MYKIEGKLPDLFNHASVTIETIGGKSRITYPGNVTTYRPFWAFGDNKHKGNDGRPTPEVFVQGFSKMTITQKNFEFFNQECSRTSLKEVCGDRKKQKDFEIWIANAIDLGTSMFYTSKLRIEIQFTTGKIIYVAE